MYSNFLEIYKNNINLPDCAKFVLNLDNVSVSSNVDVVLLYRYIVHVYTLVCITFSIHSAFNINIEFFDTLFKQFLLHLENI